MEWAAPLAKWSPRSWTIIDNLESGRTRKFISTWWSLSITGTKDLHCWITHLACNMNKQNGNITNFRPTQDNWQLLASSGSHQCNIQSVRLKMWQWVSIQVNNLQYNDASANTLHSSIYTVVHSNTSFYFQRDQLIQQILYSMNLHMWRLIVTPITYNLSHYCGLDFNISCQASSWFSSPVTMAYTHLLWWTEESRMSLVRKQSNACQQIATYCGAVTTNSGIGVHYRIWNVS